MSKWKDLDVKRYELWVRRKKPVGDITISVTPFEPWELWDRTEFKGDAYRQVEARTRLGSPAIVWDREEGKEIMSNEEHI